ncbi:TetR/AcrR family transcriptional regulator [Mucispirillum schaedleri]|uniref:TetR/AcrR family transcriptional regulator n=1 Tax=Mucispirillum schaedleri TaxID=248039 RepID=UPI001F56BDD5|nr:TetR/AcrR family transcriptional regulator [Mucispirillum schaedleri]
MRERHRSQETKERFKKAFFALYAEKKIEKITIKEVADLAGFNRGTFYLYYKSIYDLLQKSEQELLDDFAKMIDFNVQFYFGLIDSPDESRQPNSLEHTEYIRILNGENGDPRFKSRMKNIIKDAYRKHISQDNSVRVSKFEYLLEYVVEANISIFQYWFMNRDKDFPRISLKDVSEIIQYVDQNGFKKAFETFADK